MPEQHTVNVLVAVGTNGPVATIVDGVDNEMALFEARMACTEHGGPMDFAFKTIQFPVKEVTAVTATPIITIICIAPDGKVGSVSGHASRFESRVEIANAKTLAAENAGCAFQDGDFHMIESTINLQNPNA